MRLFPLLAVFALAGCSGNPGTAAIDPWGEVKGPRVLVSFPPLYSFAAGVVGDEGKVVSLGTTTGVHFHGDPSKQAILYGRKADIVFLSGLGLDEKFIKSLRKTCNNPNWNQVELAEKLDKKCLLEGACNHDHGHEGEHDHGIDPHVWLSPTRVKAMVRTIADELKKTDKAYAAGYEARAEAAIAKLDALKAYGDALLKDKTERKIVSFHDSLGYFADDFNIKIAGFIELEPGTEPNPKQMDALVKKCVEQKIRVIATEPQFSEKTAANAIRKALLQAGVEAVFVEIDPLESAAETDLSAELYDKVMRKNLENLAKALK